MTITFFLSLDTPSPPIIQPKLYSYLGCWKDTSAKAVPSLEGTNLLLKDSYSSRDYAIHLCYLTAKARGFHIFALQYNGLCMGMRGSLRYQKYGKATTCKNGKGYSAYANDVYRIGGMICVRITGSEAQNAEIFPSRHSANSTLTLPCDCLGSCVYCNCFEKIFHNNPKITIVYSISTITIQTSLRSNGRDNDIFSRNLGENKED